MLSKFEYFALALFINSVASTPYYVRKNSGREALNDEFDFPRRNDEVYLPNDEPSYMSPIPTIRDRKLNEDIIRDPRSLREPSRIENHSESKIDDDIKANVPDYNYRQTSSRRINAEEISGIPNNVAISMSSKNHPSAVVDEDKLLNGLPRQNKAGLNNVGSTVDNQQILKIQPRPENRIAFQEALVPDLTNLGSYRPVKPVNGFNINREWTKIYNEPGNLPAWIVERLKHPVDFQNVRHEIRSNDKFPEIHIQKILTNPRIQNVLASTKQIKRYMVIHPDGTVQHFDKLEHVSAQHPDFVLVKSGQIRNNIKSDVTTVGNNLQEHPSQKVVSLPNGSVSFHSKSPKSTEKPIIEEASQKEAAVQTLPSTVIDKVTSSFEGPTNTEPFDNSSSTKTADILLPSKLEPEIVSENVEILKNNETVTIENQENVEQNIASSNTLNTLAENKEIVNKINESTSNILPVTSHVTTTHEMTSSQEIDSPVEPISKTEVTNVTEDASSVTLENDSNSTVDSSHNDENTEVQAKSSSTKTADILLPSIHEPEIGSENEEILENNEIVNIKKQENVEQNMVSSNTSSTLAENKEIVNKTNESTSNILPVTTHVTTTHEMTSPQEIDSPVESTSDDGIANISEDASPVTSENETDDSNSTVDSSHNNENTEVQANKFEGSNPGDPILLDTSDPDFWQKLTEGRDSNVLLFLVNNEKDDSHSTVQSTQNDEGNEVKESSRSGKPILFDTSDPEFWQKVSDGRKGEPVVFFLIKPDPKVEKDIATTVLSNGPDVEK